MLTSFRDSLVQIITWAIYQIFKFLVHLLGRLIAMIYDFIQNTLYTIQSYINNLQSFNAVLDPLIQIYDVLDFFLPMHEAFEFISVLVFFMVNIYIIRLLIGIFTRG